MFKLSMMLLLNWIELRLLCLAVGDDLAKRVQVNHFDPAVLQFQRTALFKLVQQGVRSLARKTDQGCQMGLRQCHLIPRTGGDRVVRPSALQYMNE